MVWPNILTVQINIPMIKSFISNAKQNNFGRLVIKSPEIQNIPIVAPNNLYVQPFRSQRLLVSSTINAFSNRPRSFILPLPLFEYTQTTKTQSLPAVRDREALLTHNGSDAMDYPANRHLNRCRFYCAVPSGYPTQIPPNVGRSSRKRHTAHPGYGAADLPLGHEQHTSPWWLFPPYPRTEPASAMRLSTPSRRPAALLSKVMPECKYRHTSPALRSSCVAVRSTQPVLEQFVSP